jgi:hypothetical protein
VTAARAWWWLQQPCLNQQPSTAAGSGMATLCHRSTEQLTGTRPLSVPQSDPICIACNC